MKARARRFFVSGVVDWREQLLARGRVRSQDQHTIIVSEDLRRQRPVQNMYVGAAVVESY